MTLENPVIAGDLFSDCGWLISRTPAYIRDYIAIFKTIEALELGTRRTGNELLWGACFKFIQPCRR